MKEEHRRLIEELYYNASVSGQPLEQRLADLTIWFFNNREVIPPANLLSRIDFLEKSCSCLIELCALQAERLHEVDAHGAKSHLWLPSGMRANGKEFK